jgi:hypothetical protein
MAIGSRACWVQREPPKCILSVSTVLREVE